MVTSSEESEKNNMKIGIIRHFPVDIQQPKNGVMSSQSLKQWYSIFSNSDVKQLCVHTDNLNWDKCYASDLKRARLTAKAIFNGEIIYTEKLREMPPKIDLKQDIKLPFLVWMFFSKLSFLATHHFLAEPKTELVQRIKDFLDSILTENRDVLLVSHAVVLKNLRLELIKRGFAGPYFTIPKHGKLYLYKK